MNTPGFAAGGSLSDIRTEYSLAAVSEFRHQEGLIVPQVAWSTVLYIIKTMVGCCRKKTIYRCWKSKKRWKRTRGSRYSWTRGYTCSKRFCALSYCSLW